MLPKMRAIIKEKASTPHDTTRYVSSESEFDTYVNKRWIMFDPDDILIYLFVKQVTLYNSDD